jgi:hypothetical protein
VQEVCQSIECCQHSSGGCWSTSREGS